MYIVKYIYLATALFICSTLRSQNDSLCSVSINSISSAAYTVLANQIFCVDSNGIFTGTITVDGGKINNKGIFKPKSFTFLTGEFNNYGRAALPYGINIDSNKVFISGEKAFLRANGSVNVLAGSFVNHGILNIRDTLTVPLNGFNNTGIINCRNVIGTFTNHSNTGIINKTN